MPTFRNVSPLGDLDVPLLRAIIPAGATFEATEEQAVLLAEQPDNYQPVKGSAKTPAKGE